MDGSINIFRINDGLKIVFQRIVQAGNSHVVGRQKIYGAGGIVIWNGKQI